MSAARLAVAAITLDFGNTLVRVGHDGLQSVVEDTADALISRGLVTDRAAFLAAWAEERTRQFREDVADFREPDIPRRAARVFARLRGLPAPAQEQRWDDRAAAAFVEAGELETVADVYSDAFIARMAPVHDAGATLKRLSGRGFALAILSNWPLAVTIDRFVTAQGWDGYLRANVVSERVGTIKPHPRIFRAAEKALGIAAGPDRGAILHVGDDWAADVIGASRAGWRSAYLRDRQHDSPLPSSSRGEGSPDDAAVVADVEIDELGELDALVRLAGT